MKVIDQINGSALFAQSAYSASNATKDNLGRDITATYLTSHQSLDGYATEDWVTGQGYITEVNIPESATWQDVSTTVQSNSAQWAEGGTGGDPEVNSFVYDNSATIVDVDTTYQQNSASYLTSHQDISYKLDTTAFSTVSGDFLTAAPADMATTGDVAELAQTVSETYQTKGDYLVRSDSANFYPANNPSGFITGVDLSNYYTKDETSGKEELANAFDNIPVGDPEVNAYVTDNSATINGTTDLVQNSSGLWNDVAVYQSNSANYLTAHQDISYKLDESAFADVSGTFLTAINIPESASWEEATQAYEQNSGTYLTAHQSLDGYATEDWVTGQGYITGVNITESATWNDVSTTVQTNSSNWDNVSNKLDTTAFSDVSGTFLTAHQDLSDYYTTAEAETLSSMLSGAIDYVSANAGDEFPVSADEAIQYVQTNSGTIDDTVTSYQTNSGTFLTAHQAISADEWNSNYETVNTNSGAWGGEALPISAGPGIKVNLVNNTLVFSNDETVLYEAPTSAGTTNVVLPESWKNFDRIKVDYYTLNDGVAFSREFQTKYQRADRVDFETYTFAANSIYWKEGQYAFTTDTNFDVVTGMWYYTDNSNQVITAAGNEIVILGMTGINRK